MEFKEFELEEKDIEFDYFDKEDFEDTMDLTEVIEKTQEINLSDIEEKLLQGEENGL